MIPQNVHSWTKLVCVLPISFEVHSFLRPTHPLKIRNNQWGIRGSRPPRSSIVRSNSWWIYLWYWRCRMRERDDGYYDYCELSEKCATGCFSYFSSFTVTQDSLKIGQNYSTVSRAWEQWVSGASARAKRAVRSVANEWSVRAYERADKRVAQCKHPDFKRFWITVSFWLFWWQELDEGDHSKNINPP